MRENRRKLALWDYMFMKSKMKKKIISIKKYFSKPLKANNWILKPEVHCTFQLKLNWKMARSGIFIKDWRKSGNEFGVHKVDILLFYQGKWNEMFCTEQIRSDQLSCHTESFGLKPFHFVSVIFNSFKLFKWF